MVNVAVLMTCHNRRDKTITCLKEFFNTRKPKDHLFEIFLVDDGSTDGTKSAIETSFPKVRIIQGDGTLYWNQGMRLAWKTAIEKGNFDFFIWLNDDVILDKIALIELFESYHEILGKNAKESIIVGACRISDSEDIFSYGGRSENGKVIPNGEIQQCKYINGNIVLIPHAVYSCLGNLSDSYTHAMGDFDYGLRAVNAGFKNYTTRCYIGSCEINNVQDCFNPAVSFRKRLKHFHSPNGLNIREYVVFRRKFWGNRWILDFFKAYIKVLFPQLYGRIKKDEF
ncbi:glycosyltransferase family 2 protein [Lutimonas saemankumensis]|uniref:glycosyltransferase family 2 protein n=1 Tax=Lutimonas saemankumensis TaxID=483016 RepID=UPI001CD4747F|nr:glycosyltransferase family 2 protein [Lutimonas saemankumensis]MCA0932647.1 glycosyltransferase family 2 protein [Lutimonas saemankumensis]